MNNPTKPQAQGKVGEVYTSPTGARTYNLAMEEGNGEEGWEQVDPHNRRKVRRTQTGHTVFVWRIIEDEPPANHREYPLF